MALAHRVIPTVLTDGRALLKGEGFRSWRSVGIAEQAVRIHDRRGVDELVLLDVRASKRGEINLKIVGKLARSCFMPLTVGGGIRDVGDARSLIRAGADKVVIGRAAEIDWTVVRESAAELGSQAVTVSVDVRGGLVGAVTAPVYYAESMVRAGAGEILLQCVERDGTLQGYDLGLIKAVADAVPVPVIASGGCSGYEDMARALEAGADAVAAGALFQFTDATPWEAMRYLAEHGFTTRASKPAPTPEAAT